MRTNELTADRLRDLADLRPSRGKVLSLFVDLDPVRFADPAARSSSFGSLRHEAERAVERAVDLDDDDRRALREDLERIGTLLDPAAVPADGAGSLAIFACRSADLFEVIRLPESIEQQVHLGDEPFVAPLAAVGVDERWAVLLVDKRVARIFAGAPTSAAEVHTIDDETSGRHRKGGWSQAQYQRSVDEEVSDHLRHVAEDLFRMHERQPFDHLLLAGPVEATSEMEHRLHTDLQHVLRGRFEIEVQSSTEEQVRTAALEFVAQQREQVENDLLEELAGGRGTGRAVAGLAPVVEALVQARVRTLLLTPRLDQLRSARCCPSCDWIGADGATVCPVDGTELRTVEAAELVTTRALSQDAEVVVFREPEPLAAHEGIAAILRF
ncbi:MAG: Vms1/Ankzf1 family peptidyl-tRNA hydrolase [Patulibacter sp.]